MYISITIYQAMPMTTVCYKDS